MFLKDRFWFSFSSDSKSFQDINFRTFIKGCVDEINYEILFLNCGFKECSDFIKKNFKEVYDVPAGYRIFDSYLIEIPLIPVTVENDDIIVPYAKPCLPSKASQIFRCPLSYSSWYAFMNSSHLPSLLMSISL